MNHTDHVNLLEGEPGLRQKLGLPLRGSGGTWADLGCGEGAFTLALADLLGPDAMILAVDRDRSALELLSMAMRRMSLFTPLTLLAADFTQPLDLPLLDGMVMANSLHFVPYAAQRPLLRRLSGHIRPGGQFILVEYDADQGNLWVPYPFSYKTWETRAIESGYTKTTRLGYHAGRFLNGIYAAVSLISR